MTDLWPTVKYRLNQLRRLWAVCVALCALGAIVHIWQAAPLDPVGYLAQVIALAGLVFGILLVRYPTGLIDALGIAISAMLLLAAWPQIAALLDIIAPTWNLLAIAWRVFLVSFGSFFLYLGLVRVICMLEAVPSRQSRMFTRFKPGLPPEQAYEALALIPDQSRGNKVYSAPDENGFIRVTTVHEFPNLKTFELETQEHHYHERVLEEGPLWQRCLSVVTVEGRTSTSVTEFRISQENGKTYCTIEEVQDHLTLLAKIGYWLQDFGTDYYTAEIDDYLGQRTLAISRLPQASLLNDIAAWMVRAGLIPDPDADPEWPPRF